MKLNNHSKVDVIVLFLLLLMVCLTPMARAVELKDGVLASQAIINASRQEVHSLDLINIGPQGGPIELYFFRLDGIVYTLCVEYVNEVAVHTGLMIGEINPKASVRVLFDIAMQDFNKILLSEYGEPTYVNTSNYWMLDKVVYVTGMFKGSDGLEGFRMDIFSVARYNELTKKK